MNFVKNTGLVNLFRDEGSNCDEISKEDKHKERLNITVEILKAPLENA